MNPNTPISNTFAAICYVAGFMCLGLCLAVLAGCGKSGPAYEVARPIPAEKTVYVHRTYVDRFRIVVAIASSGKDGKRTVFTVDSDGDVPLDGEEWEVEATGSTSLKFLKKR